MLKPEAVQRRLIGAILSKIECKGYTIVALKMLQLTPGMAAKHYAEHQGKPFYQRLIDHIISGPVVAMVLEGPEIIAGLRHMIGATDPKDAFPGTIRGDYGLHLSQNIIHSADSPHNAAREIALYFSKDELMGA